MRRPTIFWRLIGLAIVICLRAAAGYSAEPPVPTGANAFDSLTMRPGVVRKITVADLPQPLTTPSARNGPRLVPRPADARPQAPAGFAVTLYAGDLDYPRALKTAPNGDVFLAESQAGEIKTFRGLSPDGTAAQTAIFATGLQQPFGIAFYPMGANPEWVYVANTNALVRFPYRSGDLQARGPAEVLAADIPGSGHWTRELAFSPDGQRLFVAVGSNSNADDPDSQPAEFRRAAILEYTPAGQFVRIYAAGLRNPVGLAFHPRTGQLWAAINERDHLGDDLPPDYITHIEAEGFYGWPWYYIGGHSDPNYQGKRPELREKVLVPDVLLQAHSTPLQLSIYAGEQFPSAYAGDVFAALHGSWNRGILTGYAVVRVPLYDGRASGAYEAFLTGFVTADGQVWGRPVGVTVAADGALLVSDDASKSIWRVSWTGATGGP